MSERLANLGYAAFGKETTPGIAVTPSFFTYVYKESISTELNLIDDNPIAGNKFARIAMLQGVRSHMGSIDIYGDANTGVYAFDMLYTRGTVTGAGPYTWPFTATSSANSYTMDFSYGNIVVRYFGVQASKVTPKWDKQVLHYDVAVSALGSFHSRLITTVATTTLTLDTTYDPNPTTGLVVGDLVRIYKSATGATLDTTIATITNGTTVTLAASAGAFAGGDYIYLRPQTPTYALLTPFLWGMAQYRPGATAAAALSATQVRIEEGGTTLELIHKFESDKGSPRSGGFDPAALLRLQADATFKIKKFFDTPEDMQTWQNIAKNAWVLRFFNGATSQYELRTTINNAKITKDVSPDLESAKILYVEQTFVPVYDTTDAQGVAVTVISNLPSF